MKKNVMYAAMGLSALSFSAQSFAEVDFIIGAGYDIGGDTMTTAYYTDGSSTKVKSAEGLSLFGGIDYFLQDSLKLRGTIGYKFSSASASNGEMTFSRIPVDLLLLRGYQRHQIGAGATYHTGVEFECDVSGYYGGCDGTVDFKDSFGFLVHYEYRVPLENNNAFVIGARYTHIDYEVKDFDVEFDGSGFGVNLGFTF
ncbi:outer membrane beta-barrel protein [Photobacterium sp. 1_MG-2023]|uniref:outer membrane beta-barrel protein n=1 Tax=Photobacterium sp. 1_MG-2023 TaxID=3062646 RepID=UPI0026E1C5DD|nr:outer membrane beta-barrel protein [Photobacterium sp. 1_MG-2023]MDO6705397.1 outer membrane beta-barrel protein [Photobacterium sp. 1_MG-2023]